MNLEEAELEQRGSRDIDDQEIRVTPLSKGAHAGASPLVVKVVRPTCPAIIGDKKGLGAWEELAATRAQHCFSPQILPRHRKEKVHAFVSKELYSPTSPKTRAELLESIDQDLLQNLRSLKRPKSKQCAPLGLQSNTRRLQENMRQTIFGDTKRNRLHLAAPQRSQNIGSFSSMFHNDKPGVQAHPPYSLASRVNSPKQAAQPMSYAQFPSEVKPRSNLQDQFEQTETRLS